MEKVLHILQKAISEQIYENVILVSPKLTIPSRLTGANEIPVVILS
jgi:hypothetical protein